MEKLISYFFFDYRLKFQTLWFKRSLYLFLIVKVIYWLCYFDLLFGTHSIVYANPKSIGPLKDLAFLLCNHTSAYLSLAFMILVLLLSVTNLFFKTYFIGDMFIWFLLINVINKIYPTLTGGDHLLSQFLLFNIFLSVPAAPNSSWQNSLRIFLHNLAVVAVLAQVCLVYFLSGLAKLVDSGWLAGTAIINISQVDHFSLYSSLRYRGNFTLALMVLNYAVLFYQLLFPLLIWIKKIKKPLLIIGILMHIYIAFVMGIVEFGAIMVLAYIYFWPSKEPIS